MPNMEKFQSMFQGLPDMRKVRVHEQERAQEVVEQVKEEIVKTKRPPAYPRPERVKESKPISRKAGSLSIMRSEDIESMERNGTVFPSWMKSGLHPTLAQRTAPPTLEHPVPNTADEDEMPSPARLPLDELDTRVPDSNQVPIDLYPPSRCTANLPDDLTLDFLVAEEKLDGGRYVLYTDCDPYGRGKGGHTVLSRKPSDIDGNLVDKTDRVPHISGVPYPGLEGTVLDGEMMREGATCLGDTSGILNANADTAVARQEAEGMIEFHVFDIICHNGQYVGSLPLVDRRPLLEKVVKQMGNPYIKCTEQRDSSHDFEDWFHEVVARGGEGLVIKDKRMSYGCGWAKMKKSYDVSLVVTGFKPGKGKYTGEFGALALSVEHKGKMVEVAYASGMDDALRTEINDNRDAYLGTVVDVFTQELTAPSAAHPCGRLRHATFYRLRDDVAASTCTYDKLVADLNDIDKVRPVRAK